jgi:microcystin-dependent protein
VSWYGILNVNGGVSTSGLTEDGLPLSTSPYFDVLISENSLFLNTPVINAPVGAIMPWAANTSPNSWLECDGSAISRTDYSTLFASIGTTYGAGNGSTTFNIPDLRGRVPVGVDSTSAHITGATTLGISGGSQLHTLTIDEMPNGVLVEKSGSDDFATSGSTAGRGAGLPHNNMQPFLTVKYIIKAVPGESVTATNYEVNQKQLAKAWVSFQAVPTPVIYSSYNISSITHISTGVFDINFIVPMSSSQYVVTGSVTHIGSQQNTLELSHSDFTTLKCRVNSIGGTSGAFAQNNNYVTVLIYSN